MLIDIRPRSVKPKFGAVSLMANHPLIPGLSLVWLLNEGGGTTVINNANPTGDLTGSLAGAASWGVRSPGIGLNFTNATGDYVRNSKLRNFARVTIAIRVQFVDLSPASFSLIGGFMDGPGSGTNDKELGLSSGNMIRWYVFDGGVKNADGTTVVTAGPIYDLVGTADGTTSRLYVNGIQDASVAAGDTYTGYTVNNIFANGSSSNFATGTAKRIFHMYVWNRALTAGDVRWLRDEPYAFLQPIPAVRYWRMSAAAAIPASRRRLLLGVGL